ncbi:MAG TPA: type II CRISPR RNA-guided endonuclease Cas9 [Syntrophomonadaceae bacterium]|nr:type II CRISPR RNA-guided endonuclease Cas9 [Syntrophomonadaceae bacterium]HPR92833.1 type II CRISPR RNA-guided endonuclease Cas9 [Syntrophomonadaceae bacterium]
MNYRLGLDIGITSVGWAVLEHDSSEEPFRIADLGVRIFDRAEHPKDGSALALPRREARSSRRRIRRHRHRLERIKALLESQGIITIEKLQEVYHGSKELTDIYELRCLGLDNLLTQEEWARVLIHLAQRRGFKSNRKKEIKENKKEKNEDGKLLAAVRDNQALMQEKNYRTIGEMFYRDDKFSLNKRNKSELYSHTVGREQILDEIAQLFTAQRRLGNSYAGEKVEQLYTDIVSRQRSFDEGPGTPSPYAGNLIERMRGKCTFEKEEPRAAKACYSFELFNLLQKINSLRIDDKNSASRPLNKEERQLLIQSAHEKADIKYTDLRKKLQLSPEQRFNTLSYGRDDVEEIEKKNKFNYLKAYHDIRIALDKVSKGRIKQLPVEHIDMIGEILTLYKNEDRITSKLRKTGLTEYDIEELLSLSYSGFGRLSLKAIKNILPYLQEGHIYSEASTLAGYNFRGHDNVVKQMYLPANNEQLQDITNPVVRRAVSQTIKVINAVIRKYGSPQLICIELSREMGKNFFDRKRIEKQIKENTDLNDAVRNKIIEYGHLNPTGLDIVKMKLWQEQDGRCAYSGEPISIQDLFDAGIADVDHIIPYSVSFDDSYANKVLVKSSENRQKGNLLPLEYMKNNPNKQEKFIVWVNTNVRNFRKQQRLLKKTITEEDRNKWKERQLNDTKYISRFMLNYIRDYLEFAPAENIGKRKVISVNGNITAYMRKRWGLKKDRLAGDLHHAQDAVVVACVTEGMIQKITRYSQYCEAKNNRSHFVDYETGEVIDTLRNRFGADFVEPWDNFKIEMVSRLSDDPALRIDAYKLDNYLDLKDIKPIFISRMPNRKNKGAAHQETIRSSRLTGEGLVVSKINITKLKLDADGEIANYYNPKSDMRLYNALKNRLQQFNGNGEAAFKEPVYKPAAPGKTISPVKKVKVIDKSNLNVAVGKGVAANGDMLRIDVFKKGDGYYWVPIYVADTVKETLPNKACVHSKPYELWKEMDDNDFIFSLYPNDLIRFIPNNGEEAFMYYIKAGISTASITVESHDRSQSIPSLGVKTLKILEKWNVDVLGNRTLVKNEKRQYYPGQTTR